MRALAAVAVLGGALACHRQAAPLFPAGTTYDEGHGELALASIRLLTPADAPPAEPRRSSDEAAWGDPDDPAGALDPAGSFGGDAYGGSTYAGYIVPTWHSVSVERRPRYRQTAGLSGAIEGVVSWRGAVPGKLTTSCGAIEPLAVGGDRGLAGALVYIEKVAVGRAVPSEDRPVSVGGLVVKRGCALAPAVQVATPLPSPLVVHGDGKRAALRVTPPAGAARTHELLEAGRVGLQVTAGVTRIDAADGSFGSAWVIGLETPYYALTDDRGRFRLDELAAGTYEVTIWHPPVPALANGALAYGPPIVAKRTVRVEAARTARLDVGLGPGPGPGPGAGR
jgi:hypothetical protein